MTLLAILTFITDNVPPLRPLSAQAELFNLRWAQRDLQSKDPCHPDLAWLVLRITHLEASYAR